MKTQVRLDQLHDEFINGKLGPNTPTEGVQSRIEVEHDRAIAAEDAIAIKIDKFFRLYEPSNPSLPDDLAEVNQAMIEADDELVDEINSMAATLAAKLVNSETRIVASESSRVIKYRVDLNPGGPLVDGKGYQVPALDMSGSPIVDGNGNPITMYASSWADIVEAELGVGWAADYSLDYRVFEGNAANYNGIRFIRNGQKLHNTGSMVEVLAGQGDWTVGEEDVGAGMVPDGNVYFRTPNLDGPSGEGDYIFVEIYLAHNDVGMNLNGGGMIESYDYVWRLDGNGNLENPGFMVWDPTISDMALTTNVVNNNEYYAIWTSEVGHPAPQQMAETLAGGINDFLTQDGIWDWGLGANQHAMIMITENNLHSYVAQQEDAPMLGLSKTAPQGSGDHGASVVDNNDGTFSIVLEGLKDAGYNNGKFDGWNNAPSNVADIWFLVYVPPNA